MSKTVWIRIDSETAKRLDTKHRARKLRDPLVTRAAVAREIFLLGLTKS